MKQMMRLLAGLVLVIGELEDDRAAAQRALLGTEPFTNFVRATLVTPGLVQLRLKKDARTGSCPSSESPSNPFEHGFWSKFASHSKVFCAGRHPNSTEIRCFSDKSNFDRPTYCSAENLYGVCNNAERGEGGGAAHSRNTVCKWHAFCEPTAEYWAYKKKRGGKFPRGDSFAEIARMDSTNPPHAKVDARTYYIANGDCASANFNPAHCVADVANMYAMRRSVGVLPETSRDVVAVLANGFNHVGPGTPFYDLWNAMADQVITQTEQARSVRVSKALFSPPSFISPTWRSNHPCVGLRRSPLIAEMHRELTPPLDSLAAPRWARWLLNSKQGATWFSPPETWNSSSRFLLFALRCPPSASSQIAALPVKSRPRCIWNFNQLWAAARLRFPTQPMLAVYLHPEMDFLAQYALFRRAKVVVGLHGGQLGHSLWLREGQGLLELGHDHETNNPSMFAGMAAANGGAFRWLGNPPPMTKKNGGNVQIQKVLQDLAPMLYGSSSSSNNLLPFEEEEEESPQQGPRVTISQGPGAGVDYSCAEKDAMPMARTLIGVCVMSCDGGFSRKRRPAPMSPSEASRRCGRAIELCSSTHHPDCVAVDVNKFGTFATLKAANTVTPKNKHGCPPPPDVGSSQCN